MAVIIAVHVLILLLGLAIGTRVMPQSSVAGAIDYLHKTIGITVPATDQVRMVALIWIGAVVVIADGVLLLLVFLATQTHAG
jgi:hypothetical protein